MEPSRRLLLECARDLTTRGITPFSSDQLIRGVQQRDPARARGSLSPIIQGMTANAPGGPASAGGTPFTRVGRGLYVLNTDTPSPALSASVAKSPYADDRAVRADAPADLILVGCVKTKLDRPAPAKDLYVSAMFERRRRFAEASGVPWYILSAEHGLLTPDALVEPYDVYLSDQSPEYRRAWGDWVVVKLQQAEGTLQGRRVEIHASEPYVAAVRSALHRLGADVVEPLAGLRQGEQLAWYGSSSTVAPISVAPRQSPPPVEHASQAESMRLEDLVLLAGPTSIPRFDYRWPEGVEQFDVAWQATVELHGRTFDVRHGLAWREAFGRRRRRSVTWINNNPVVEGVGPDAYEQDHHLISALRHPDKTLLRPTDEVPGLYRDFPLSSHRDEIVAPYSRDALAVKLPEQDVMSWVGYAFARKAMTSTAPAVAPVQQVTDPNPAHSPVGGASTTDVVQALLTYGAEQAPAQPGVVSFTPHPEANHLVLNDAFAFLLGVVFDQGIPAERAWRAPYDLKVRLGHLDPSRLVADPSAVHAAVAQPPVLHRYREKMPVWLVAAAQKVMAEYRGDAARIWADAPTAAELQRRFDAFPGIGQKKAAMAVEILERDLGVDVRELSGSDIAFDVHVRRVFLRTHLAQYDDLDHMVAVARAANPDRPGAIDMPAWLVGRQWCHAGTPKCAACVLRTVCPKDVSRASAVRGA